MARAAARAFEKQGRKGARADGETSPDEGVVTLMCNVRCGGDVIRAFTHASGGDSEDDSYYGGRRREQGVIGSREGSLVFRRDAGKRAAAAAASGDNTAVHTPRNYSVCTPKYSVQRTYSCGMHMYAR